jgi:Putative Flp pilus-assembly TadE/G-like
MLSCLIPIGAIGWPVYPNGDTSKSLITSVNTATNRNRQAGQALYLTAMSLVVVIGFLGLGIDLGALRYEKRLQQTAADAAAIAGASNICTTTGCGITTAAQAAATANGFTDTAGGHVSDCESTAAVGTVCVQVNSVETTGGPQGGPHVGNPNYVEVLVAAVHPTYFMRIFGVTKETVTARAVATNAAGGTNSGCVYTLESSGNGIRLNGSDVIAANGCRIVDNSNLAVGGGSISATSIGVGGECGFGGCSGANPTPVTGIPAAGDPLAYLATPPANGTPQPATVSGTAQPGYYGSGLSVSGDTNFNSGVYYISGNLTFTSAGAVTGNGVMFYITGGTVDWGNASNQTSLSAPSSSDSSTGAVAGVLFWQDKSDPNPAIINGNSSSSLEGVMYFPGARLNVDINNMAAPYTMIVADSLRMSGNNQLNLSADTSSLVGGSPIKNAVLVE